LGRNSEKDLHRYCDGELSPAAARRVRARAEGHPDDKRRIEAIGQLREALRATAEDVADEADFSQLWGRVERGIAAESIERPADPAGRRLLRWGLAAASVVAAVVIAVVLWYPSEPVEEPGNEAVIESLEVGPEAVGTVFTFDDPVHGDESTVIWVHETQGGQ